MSGLQEVLGMFTLTSVLMICPKIHCEAGCSTDREAEAESSPLSMAFPGDAQAPRQGKGEPGVKCTIVFYDSKGISLLHVWPDCC